MKQVSVLDITLNLLYTFGRMILNQCGSWATGRSPANEGGLQVIFFLFPIMAGSLLLVLFSGSPGMGKELKQIILLESMSVKVVIDRSHWFQVQMSELGYRDGLNMTLTVLNAKGSYKQAESLLKTALLKNTPDLVVTNATVASKAGIKLLKNTNIPQLFLTVSDPVGAGLVEKVGVPSGKNITGRIHNITRETIVKLVFRLIGEKIKRRPVRFGYIHSSYASAVADLRQLKELAEKNKNITFFPYEIKFQSLSANLSSMLTELPLALKQLEGKIDFLWTPLDPFAESVEYNKIIMEKASVPVVFGVNKKSAQLGALIFVAPDPEAEGREVGVLADRILKGEYAGDIPVIPPLTFRLGVNLTTATKMDIVIPPDILKLAGQNIFR